ncbi:MAG: protease complex subunit PrcB family protein [Bacteroidota bacterium]
MKRTVLISILSFVFVGCSCYKKNISKESETNLKNEVPFKVVYKTFNSPYKEKRFEVLTNKSDFDNFIKQLNLEENISIDFTKSNVVILNMAERNTGGYDIVPITLDQVNETLVLKVKEKSPKPNEMVTMAFTSPLTILEINSKKEITISLIE